MNLKTPSDRFKVIQHFHTHQHSVHKQKEQPHWKQDNAQVRMQASSLTDGKRAGAELETTHSVPGIQEVKTELEAAKRRRKNSVVSGSAQKQDA